VREQYAPRLPSSSVNRLPKHATIDHAYSLVSVLLVGAERFFAFSVQRVHRIRSGATQIAHWLQLDIYGPRLVLCEVNLSHGAFVVFHRKRGTQSVSKDFCVPA
jgi:hypothetical protein